MKYEVRRKEVRITKYEKTKNSLFLQTSDFRFQKGFTLTEFLVAIGIVIILASVGILTLRNIRPSLQLSGATRDLVTDLRYTQQLAVTEQVDHGVWFSTTTNDHKYRIIRHEDSTTTTIKEVLLSQEGINFQYISPLIDNEVRFNPYGAAREAATTTLKNVKNKTKTIRVSPSGFVKMID